MSYTSKIILLWLGVWLGVAVFLLVVANFGNENFNVEEGLLGLSLIGFFFSVVQFLVGAVILLTGAIKNNENQNLPDDLLDSDAGSNSPSFQERGLAHLAAGGLTLLIGGSVCFSLF